MDQDWPITHVIVVTEASKCPPGYTLIDKTYDRREEADLWRDGLFGRRVYRFLCVERCAPSPGRDVLVDTVVINEKDPIPAGFTCVDYTSDTRERAVKKKVLCVRYMSSELTNDAISELVLLSKGVRRPPGGYTLVGELNNMALCYKMTTFRSQIQSQEMQKQSSPVFHTQGYTTDSLNMNQMASNLPYDPTPKSPTKTATLERAVSNVGMGTMTALSGVPFQCNPLLTALQEDIVIPQIQYKSIMDIERQYEYSFSVERSAAARITS